MTSLNRSTLRCRCCKYFAPLGQRGGTCKVLNNCLVKGQWKSCSLSNPAFEISTTTNVCDYALSSS